jgi:hypothetical protein
MVSRIQQIQTITEIGIYAPETANGDIIVNDIVASCYSDFKRQNIAGITINTFKEVRIKTFFNP